MKRFEDKVAVVTGGGGGIGGAVARRFAAEGARVAVLDRDPDAAGRTVQQIQQAGGTALVVE
jgi:2-hydroxycyclohexanecarboxyl-CoA dehydrogenase